MHTIIKKSGNNSGFSLVEILVTMVIMGLVVVAVYSLYQGTQRTANTSEEVVEVQQNLRIASEWLARDLRMAGFLVNGDAIANAATDTITLTMATSGNKIARISNPVTRCRRPPQRFPGRRQQYAPPLLHGDTVRIIRPRNASQPYLAQFTVTDLSAVASDVLPLDFPNAVVLTTIAEGDMVVSTPGGTCPRAIRYFLDPDPDSNDPAMKVLKREDTGTASVVANKVTSLTFSYLMSNGTEQASVPTNLGDIVGVRVRIQGATDNTKTGSANYSGVKSRGVEIVVMLHNI